MPTALNFRFDGSAFWPVNLDAARQAYEPGRIYRLVEQAQRSGRSHRHYFSCVHQAWSNLPEPLAPRFPTSEHLRKYALISTGHCRQRVIVCQSSEDAALLVGMVEAFDEYSVCSVQGAVVTVFTAASQSLKAMGKATFQKSKTDVIDYLAAYIGVTSEELSATGRKYINE